MHEVPPFKEMKIRGRSEKKVTTTAILSHYSGSEHEIKTMIKVESMFCVMCILIVQVELLSKPQL